MKGVSSPQLEAVIENIMADKEKQAKVLGQPFIGVTSVEVLSELNKRMGSDWILRKEQPMKFTKEDINAVANSRFYRKTGLKLLMLLAIVILGLSSMSTWAPNLIPPYAYYGLYAGAAMLVFWQYAKKQRQVRKELWKSIEGDGIESGQ